MGIPEIRLVSAGFMSICQGARLLASRLHLIAAWRQQLALSTPFADSTRHADSAMLPALERDIVTGRSRRMASIGGSSIPKPKPRCRKM